MVPASTACLLTQEKRTHALLHRSFFYQKDFLILYTILSDFDRII